jgi:hypothetical protein
MSFNSKGIKYVKWSNKRFVHMITSRVDHS